jgi:hypothetical protein
LRGARPSRSRAPLGLARWDEDGDDDADDSEEEAD